MTWYVFYKDDFCDLDGIGFNDFDSQKDAVAFIEKRMADGCDRVISEYTLVEGRELKLVAYESVTKIRVQRE